MANFQNPGAGGQFVTDATVQAAIEAAYYNVNVGGFGNARQLYQNLRTVPAPANLTPGARWPPSYATVLKVLRAQQVQQTLEPRNPPMTRKDYNTTLARQPLSSVQGDLMEMARLCAFNNNTPATNQACATAMNYILVLIDVGTRKIWVRQLRTKDEAEVTRSIKELIWNMNEEARRAGKPWMVKNLNFDKEGAVTSNNFKAWMDSPEWPGKPARPWDERQIRLWLNGPDRGKAAQFVVERVIRTLRQWFRRYFRALGTRRWRDQPLQVAAATYNSSYHSSLVPYESPNNVMEEWPLPGSQWPDGLPKYIKEANVTDPTLRFQIGDVVRIAKPIVLTEKPTDRKLYSKALYTVIAQAPDEATVGPAVAPNGGLALYNMGWKNQDARNPAENMYTGFPPDMRKVGRGNRFILQRQKDGAIRERMWYNMKKVDAGQLRVANVAPPAAQPARNRSFTRQIRTGRNMRQQLGQLQFSAPGPAQAPSQPRRGASRINWTTYRGKIKFNYLGSEQTAKVTGFDPSSKKVSVKMDASNLDLEFTARQLEIYNVQRA